MSSTQTLKRFLYHAGDLPKPETNKNHLRVYGHTLCPFVGIARYALALKKVEFQDCQVNLEPKAAWHLELNGGMIPVLETPAGDLIRESGVIAQLAIELGGDQGIELVPKDPIVAAKMRLEIEAFRAKMSIFWPVIYPSVGTDNATIDKFGTELLPIWEAMAAKTSEGKWLFGTQEPTLLDVNVAPFLEILYLWQQSVMSNVTDRLELATKAPNLIRYVEMWQAHPLVNPHHMRQKAANAHWARSRGWEKGVKCQLSTAILEGVFEDL